MPQNPPIKPGTPSKNAENQDAVIMTRSQPSTSEEVEARTGQPTTSAARRDGGPADQTDRATGDAARERADQYSSCLNEGDR